MLGAVKGFPGYFVSKDGDVFSRKSYGLKKLKPSYFKAGHAYVGLHYKGKKHKFLVHRLVADTFLHLEQGQEITHRNRNKADNRLVNLIICNHSGTIVSFRHAKKLTEEKVYAIRNLCDNSVLSVKEIAEKFSISTSMVYQLHARTSWRHIKDVKRSKSIK